MKLSDTHLLILSSALQRTDHAAVLPANLKGSAAKNLVGRLLNQKFLRELRAKDGMPTWRRGADNKPYSLQITKAGLKAITVQEVAKAPDHDAAADSAEVAASDATTKAKSGKRPARAKRAGAKKTAAVSAKATKELADQHKPDSQQDKIVALLQRPRGAALDDLVKETGWQKHSVRGFLAGTVRKKLKLKLMSKKIDGVRTYRIGVASAAKTKKTSAAQKA